MEPTARHSFESDSPDVSRFCLFKSRTAIAGDIGLLLVFLFRRRDFCYDHMTSRPLQICFLFIRSCSFN